MKKQKELDGYAQSIAIIGMCGRFPGAKNLQDFWKNLENSVESISWFDHDDDDLTFLRPPHVRAFGSLEGIEWFDASFFKVTPREATITDPQRRVLLECAYEVLENAGYVPSTYKGKIGVYVGEGENDYLIKNLKIEFESLSFLDRFNSMIGNQKDFAATQISYKLDLKGPSINIATACSTSLVAVHEACKSLLCYETEMVIAGGVRICIPQNEGHLYEEGGIFSPDGHCRAFDEKAKGTVGGNGIGLVLLKRVEDALRDGDTIHAIIRGSAVNNDGAYKVGYTAPSIQGQALVISEAQAVAGVEPETITYIEAHGTGTPLGDPIEIQGLTEAFQKLTNKNRFCAIGSVKTNIGHLDVAAGIAGLIKTVLALKKHQIPASLHFQKPNDQIDLDCTPFYINNCLSDWTSDGCPRRAGVSSFGIGGTNAHVVLEEFIEEKSSLSNHSYHLLIFSAKTPNALEATTGQLVSYLKDNNELSLADVAFTLQIGRQHFSQRRVMICQGKNDFIEASEEQKRIFTGQIGNISPSLVFMFPGQGSQHINMAGQLYIEEPVFKKTFDLCAQILKDLMDICLDQIIYPFPHEIQGAQDLLKQTRIAQPALFVIEYSLANLWASWGIKPQVMIGHSIGEYVAACLAGVFSLEQALLLVSYRGRLMQEMPKGQMVTVNLSEEKVLDILKCRNCDLAAINGSYSHVIAGSEEEIAALIQDLEEKNVKTHLLSTSHAFHSRMMDPILNTFYQQVEKIKLNKPQIPFISNVTGKFITDEEATNPQYWVNHLRKPVRFLEGMKLLFQDPNHVYLEVGPDQVLTVLSLMECSQGKVDILSSLPHHRQKEPDKKCILETLGKLWLLGAPVEWSELYGSEKRRRVPLPTYPFERQKYWIEPTTFCKTRHKLEKRAEEPECRFYLPSWKRAATLPFTSHEFSSRPAHWLIFADALELAEHIVQHLQEEKQQVTVVKPGNQYKKLDENCYQIDPASISDYRLLFTNLKDQGISINCILHMWTFASNQDSLSFEESQDLGFMSIIFLTQCIAQQSETVKMVVVSNALHEVSGKEDLVIEKSTLLGPCKVIQQEYTNIQCSCVDITLEDAAVNPQRLKKQILSEFFHGCLDKIVAYRGKYRWIEDFIPISQGSQEANIQIREKGVYLITGGLGTIGLAFSEYLAIQGAAHLILIGRSDFPQEKEWSRWIEIEGEHHPISKKIRKLQLIQKAGASIHLFQADVCDEEQMKKILCHTEKIWGNLNGVIHAAGNLLPETFRYIEDITKESCEEHFISKIYGSISLGKVLEGRKYDFCILISSLASILGGLGYTSYAAANLFMDAYVHKHNRESSVPWLSLNWDGWNFGETDEKGKLLLTFCQCFEAFHFVLSNTFPSQLLISAGDLWQRRKDWVHQERDSENSELPSTVGLIDKISHFCKELLGIDHIDLDENLFELGGDSLLMTRLLLKISKACNTTLFIRDMMSKPTIRTFVDIIEGKTETAFCAEQTYKKDAVLQEDLTPALGTPLACNSLSRAIFITGATGFLGIHLLHDLCQLNQGDIYCLIRAKNLQEAYFAIKKSCEKYLLPDLSACKRIIPILGDLTKPLLGLTPLQFDSLSRAVDVIYHVGAHVHHIYDYEKLRPTNILGTVELIKFSMKSKIKEFHYISSISAAVEKGQERFPQKDDCGNIDGYSQTKWVCEKLLAQASSRGIPVMIYRPCTITGRSYDGICCPDRDHLMCMIKSCIQAELAPDWPLELDIMPVDIVSAFILHASLRTREYGRVFNIVDRDRLIWKHLIDWLQDYGYQIRITSDSEWRSKHLQNLPKENALYPLLPLYMHNKGLYSEAMGKFLVIEDENACEIFRLAELIPPPINKELFNIYFTYLRKCQFLDSPPAVPSIYH